MQSGSNAELRKILSGMKGYTEPRLFTPPLRRLTRKTTRGYEVIDFARDVVGQPLTPWQEWVVIHALELNPDGSYRFRIVLLLVARQNGKSHLGKMIKLWKLYVDGCKLMIGAGQDLALAREMWDLCVETIRETPDLASELKGEPVKGNNLIELRLVNGARYRLTATNSSKPGRGLSVDHLDFEELREQRSWVAWASLSKTTSARPRPQIWCNSNAGDDESVVLNQLRESALSDCPPDVDIATHRGEVNGADPSVGIFEYSAPDGCDLDDPHAIAQANPGLGTVLSAASLLTSLATDPPAVFRTEVLCQQVDALDGAFNLVAWRDCKDASGSLVSGKDELSVVFDSAPDGEHATLVGAVLTRDGRVRLEVFATWRDLDTARWELPTLLDELAPGNVGWFPNAANGPLAPIFRREPGNRQERKGWRKNIIELTGTKVTESCQLIVDLVKARKVLHPDDKLLNAHVIGAKKLDQGDGWRFVRKGVGHVDGAYAAGGAAYVAMTYPVVKKKGMIVV
jgi:hypothetical protein